MTHLTDRKSWLALIFLSMLLSFSNTVFADVIHVKPNTIISTPTTFDNETLDMSKGSFIIKDNAVLTIKNSTVKGLLSKKKAFLFSVEKGKLVMKENEVKVTTQNIKPHPMAQSLENVIVVNLGNVELIDNNFSIDTSFTAGLLLTLSGFMPTQDYKIVHNTFENFHGVLYLVAVDKALISKNKFNLNSYGHIVVIGTNAEISHNKIMFSGNDHLGNSIDVINSNNVKVLANKLLTPTCHGIYVINSSNVEIDSNQITGGITYAINVYNSPEMPEANNYVKELANNKGFAIGNSHNIVISNNYMSQNRYGLAASDIDDMRVTNNIFIQRFDNDVDRKFWTDNANLLKNVTNLEWKNNLYKEAFTQVNGGDNSKSLRFVTFPKFGGVDL